MTTKNAIEAAKITKKLKNFTLDVEIVVLYVGFHAVFGHEEVILFGAIAGISNHRMGHPVIPV